MEGSAGTVFQRHSRTVMVFVRVSIEINWKDSRVSSFAETLPFMGESTLKQGREKSLSGAS
ncbi:MAG TPA: hypothetical protein VE035_18185, partial [Puia sp.]|nr:hypothetical protein [Puia sp.]